jgi:hypothetical protein
MLNLYYQFSSSSLSLLQSTAESSHPISDLPMMRLTQSTIVAGPSLCECFSATTMLDTIGHDSIMNSLSTSRHDAIFCGKVPPANHRP